MRKFYSILLLLLTLILLTTYNPSEMELISNQSNSLFDIKNIKIINNEKINQDVIEKKLKKIYGKNIFFIKTSEIEKVIRNITYLQSIEVKKKYPNTLIVKVFETSPLAILLKNSDYYILDSGANLILINADSVTNYNYPHIFGKNSEKYFLNFLKLLKENNFPIIDIKSYYYFQIGRWDLQLKDGLLIRLPNNMIKNAIEKSVELLNKDDFKNYEVIDLRINGRIIVN
tara:strand:- start:97 stop:783 length:687 start_codon:yes stop_codon:yes gene_type:complete